MRVSRGRARGTAARDRFAGGRLRRMRHGWVGFLFLLAATAPLRAAEMGDVTRDGRVAVDDAIRILRISLRLALPTTEEAILADVAPYPGTADRFIGDRQIDVRDAVRLLRRIVGLLSEEEFGATVSAVIVTPDYAFIGPLDEMTFTAVPIHVTGPVEWTLVSGASNPGSLSIDGVYTAPARLIGGLLSVTVVARVGAVEGQARVDITDIPPPPPPPI